MAYAPEIRERYFRERRAGASQVAACQTIGVDRKTGRAWEAQRSVRQAGGAQGDAIRAQDNLPMPKPRAKLSPDAQRGLDDFAFWRQRYLGRTSTYWQDVAATQLLEWLATPDREFIVENCPPGSGKTTKWSDIVTWLICRDRTLRFIWLSSTLRLAAQPVNRVRRALERVRPLPGADACLAKDYGRFRPDSNDIWRREEFTVMALDAVPLEDKEPTVAAYGQDSEFLGHRAHVVIGDDVVTGKILKSIDQVGEQQRWWSDEGETRVEPGGVGVLNGQRMGPTDLYRYCLDQTDGHGGPRYRHIVYKAHFEDVCSGDDSPDHATTGRPWDGTPNGGCLLDPVRIPFKELTAMQRNRAIKYRVQYQQEEVDPATVLVEKAWVSGGVDTSGFQAPGCWDQHRGRGDIPKGLSQPYYSIATSDPSPTKFWATTWWLYHPASEQRFLLDLVRQSMEASDFLDWNANDKVFFGLMEDWQLRSKELGAPITHWVIEKNGAQRFLLQYDHVKRWQRKHGVQILPHNTGTNKLDEDFGLQSIANRFKFGNIRLPGLQRGHDLGAGRMGAMKLVDEATSYATDGSYKGTDDCLMATWFMEMSLPVINRDSGPAKSAWRPSFVKRKVAA